MTMSVEGNYTLNVALGLSGPAGENPSVAPGDCAEVTYPEALKCNHLHGGESRRGRVKIWRKRSCSNTAGDVFVPANRKVNVCFYSVKNINITVCQKHAGVSGEQVFS